MKKNIGTLGILTAIFLLWASQGWAATLTFDDSIHGESSFTATVDGIKVTLSNPKTKDGTTTNFETLGQELFLSNASATSQFDITFDQTVTIDSIVYGYTGYAGSAPNGQYYFTFSQPGGGSSGQHDLQPFTNMAGTFDYIPGTLPQFNANTDYNFNLVLTHDFTPTPALDTFTIVSLNFSPIPEPGTMTLLSLGLILGHGMRNRNQAQIH